MSAFREGFNAIFPISSLACFYEDEIEAMLCGGCWGAGCQLAVLGQCSGSVVRVSVLCDVWVGGGWWWAGGFAAMQCAGNGGQARQLCTPSPSTAGTGEAWSAAQLAEVIKFDHGYTAASPPVVALLEVRPPPFFPPPPRAPAPSAV